MLVSGVNVIKMHWYCFETQSFYCGRHLQCRIANLAPRHSVIKGYSM